MSRITNLVVVGTGISASHITSESRGWIQRADDVPYVVADPVSANLIEDLNPNSHDLTAYYRDGKSRSRTYFEIIEDIMSRLRSGRMVCAVFYGHPGVFVYPSHEVITKARSEGFVAQMLPAVSAEDCVFADIGFDPSRCGCSSFEATDFLIHDRIFDPQSYLILWQVGVIGDGTHKEHGYGAPNIDVLVERLLTTYPSSHDAIIYEASHYAICQPKINKTTIANIENADITGISTLVVPPLDQASADSDMISKLGMTEEDLLRQRSPSKPSFYNLE